jgi:serine/threonine-protein kinase
MGQVYAARDDRIGRDVAIKVLPAAYAADAERLKRFEQEARASGALSHPNVLTLHDVGTSDGRPYLVMELLDGETLRDRVSRGPMPAPRACEVAAAVARGLAAAHAKGIVHRDLKPENVMVTRDGQVKILDFGIAKLRAREPGPGGRTVTTPLRTAPDTMLGTAGYMAPEQIRGLHTDERADLFALGAILFELLTGGRAFDRDSRVETLNAILHDDPPALNAAAVVPPAVDLIVRRCLEKDLDARFQSARDLTFALDTVASMTTSTSTSAARPAVDRRRDWRIPVATVLVVTGLAGLAIWRLRPAAIPTTRPLGRFAIQAPPRAAFYGVPAISPDGSLFVYSATQGMPDTRRLFLRRLDQLTTTAMPGTEGAFRPFFSPDGQSVGFWADNKLKTTKVMATASPVVVCDVELFLGGTWTSDGSIVFSSIAHGLQRVSANGGVPQTITTLDRARPEIDHHAPQLLPGGRALLLTIHEGEARFRIDALILATGERKTLVETGFDAQYSATGHLVYGTSAGLSAVPFDLDRLEVTGAPARVFDDVATDPHDGIANFSLSTAGTLVFFPQAPPPRRTLVWMDRSGTATPLPIEPRTFATPRLSPDGRKLAVVVNERERQNIWVYHLGNRTSAPVTFEGINEAPLWTRDGLRLTYLADLKGIRHLMWQPTDASSPAESLISSTNNNLFPAGWAADGRSLVYMDDPPTNNSDIRLLTLEGRRSAPLPNIPTRSNWPAVSPDGRWLAFVSRVSMTGRPDIYVQPFPGPGPLRQLVEGGTQPVWGRDGRELFFRSQRGAPPSASGLPVGDGIFVQPFDRERGVASAREAQLFRARMTDDGAWGVPSFDVSPDGRRFLVVMAGDTELAPVDLNVMLHFDDELRRRVR